jgi:hypothetical protein
MRFAFLLVGGIATGALATGAVRTMVPSNAPMFQAVRALGGDMSNFKLGDINPLKAYDDVKHQITSGIFGGSINIGSGTPAVSFPKVGDLSLGNKMHIDEAAIKRSIAAGISSSIQQNNRRMEDIAAYGRNPMAWHGPPPH